MSKDLLEAAYRDFDKAVQQHEHSKTHASEKALYEARINVLSIRNDLKERKIKGLPRGGASTGDPCSGAGQSGAVYRGAGRPDC